MPSLSRLVADPVANKRYPSAPNVPQPHSVATESNRRLEIRCRLHVHVPSPNDGDSHPHLAHGATSRGQTKRDAGVTSRVAGLCLKRASTARFGESAEVGIALKHALQLGRGVSVCDEGRVDVDDDDGQIVVGAVQREWAFCQAALEERE